MARDEILRLALDALRAHKLRSFLTLLGVIIGVGTVIAVVSVIQGLDQYVTSRVMEFGSTSFSVTKFSQGFNSLDDYWREVKRRNITLDDMKAIEAGCPHCQYVAGVYNDIKTVKYRDKMVENAELRGVSVHAPFIGQVMELSAGRHFTEVDIDHARMVVILGGDVAERLFPYEDPIGKDVLVDGVSYTVLGVAKKTGDFMGQPQDTFVRIPITVFMRHYNVSGRSMFIQVQARTPEDMRAAMDEARVVLRNRFHRMYKDDDGFSMATADTFLDLWRKTTGSIFLVTIALASIALVVGGVVIMNIMLVSVTERTREIGVRKALGARQADILGQFLAEAVTLAALGGVLGIAGGIFLAYLVSWFSPLPVAIRWWAVLVALAVASSIGIAAGIYPARRAASLDPVVALRAE
jgi:putative ABC transport system permease protein